MPKCMSEISIYINDAKWYHVRLWKQLKTSSAG